MQLASIYTVERHVGILYRDLEKKDKDRKEKEREERRRAERKNRDAFKELLKSFREEGSITPKMRWKVGSSRFSLPSLCDTCP